MDKNYSARGVNRIFCIPNLKYPPLYVCSGPKVGVKCIRKLLYKGAGCVSGARGCGGQRRDLSPAILRRLSLLRAEIETPHISLITPLTHSNLSIPNAHVYTLRI